MCTVIYSYNTVHSVFGLMIMVLTRTYVLYHGSSFGAIKSSSMSDFARNVFERFSKKGRKNINDSQPTNVVLFEIKYIYILSEA